jgi:PAS domain S-box-containing protein
MRISYREMTLGLADSNGRIILTSNEARNVFGATSANLLGRSLSQFIPDKHEQQEFDAFLYSYASDPSNSSHLILTR